MVIIISIVSSAARPELWVEFYERIGINNIDFELIFVGPNSPDYMLPDNFNFVKSQVKPVQCFEIAARISVGKYLIMLADDMFFETDNPLDKLYQDYLSYNTDKLMLSCGYSQYFSSGIPRIFEADFHKFIDSKNNEIVMPVGLMIDRKYYRHLGGLDRNFIALYWDLDLCFRVVEDGGITALSNVIIKDIDILNCGGLYSEFYQIDQFQTLSRIWPFLPNTPFKRTTPLEPFIDDNILIVSQGPKGRWI